MNSLYISSNAHLCRFLQVSGNSWHNALYIECSHCSRAISKKCRDLLCVFFFLSRHVFIPRNDAELLWQTAIDKTDCVAVLSRNIFVELHKSWLFSHLDDPSACPLSGLYEDLPPCTIQKSPVFPNL